MKLRNLKNLSILTVLLLPSISVASECYECGENITNNFFTEEVENAVALSAAIPDLLPDVGNSRIDFALSNYGNRNAVGGTFMHNFDSKGTLFEGTNIKSTSLGVSAATGEGDGNKWLFRIQAGIEF